MNYKCIPLCRRCYSRYEKDASELLRKTFWRAMFECHAGLVFSAAHGTCSPGKCSSKSANEYQIICKSTGSFTYPGGDCKDFYR